MSRHLPKDRFNEIRYVIDNNFNDIIINDINLINGNNISYSSCIVNDFKNHYVWGKEYCFLFKNISTIKIRFNHRTSKIDYNKFKLNLESLHYNKKLANDVQIGFKIEYNNSNTITENDKINISNIIHNTIKNYSINYNPSLFIINKEIKNHEFIRLLIRKAIFPSYKQITDNDSIYFINKKDIIIKPQSEYAKS